MNIPNEHNKFINTLLPTKSSEYSNKNGISSKDRNMKITENKLLVFIVNIQKRNCEHFFPFGNILFYIWLTLFYGYKEVVINVNSFVIYNLWFPVIYVHIHKPRMFNIRTYMLWIELRIITWNKLFELLEKLRIFINN